MTRAIRRYIKHISIDRVSHSSGILLKNMIFTKATIVTYSSSKIKVATEKQKREIMRKKLSKLRRRREIIDKDLTWRERKMKWKLETIVRKEKGNKIWLGYGRIRIEET